MGARYENTLREKMLAITMSTLIVGIDIAKTWHWARFVDFRGLEHDRALKFKNSKDGFESLLARIMDLRRREGFASVVVAMEPTGHYWKPIANWLEKQEGIKVVLVNTYATKQAKELDDNSQTKCDKKDALTIARLAKDGRYLEPYMPRDIFADLRVMSAGRTSLNRRKGALKNEITAIMDEHFPEFAEVFKRPLDGKAARQILEACPFPSDIIALGEEGVLTEIRKAVKKSVGAKKAAQLVECAKNSIGVDCGLEAARLRLGELLEGLERLERRTEEMERKMEEALQKIAYADNLLGIKGIGIVTLAALLGELGDILRFESPRQMSRMAGYNLVEASSGKNKSGTRISKRGRKNLRSALYQMTLAMVASNAEMKRLYNYLKTRKKNPLKKMQALVAVGNKILAVIHALARNKEQYDPNRVFGRVRKGQLEAAA